MRNAKMQLTTIAPAENLHLAIYSSTLIGSTYLSPFPKSAGKGLSRDLSAVLVLQSSSTACGTFKP